MSKISIIALVLLSSCSITDPYYLNLNRERQHEFRINKIDTTNEFLNEKSIGIYSINSSELKYLINKTASKYKLLIFFTNWCPNSSESVPVLLNDLSKIDKLDIILISPDDWVRKKNYLGYINKYNLNFNVYLLDVFLYGEKRSPHYRMGKFITEICSDCNDIGGFPSFILFDQQNFIIFKHTGKIETKMITSIMQN
ncbi:MAG: hypothetical protein LWW88_07690 [Acinetobacter sp.]|uniref:TlpA family protein disulfide reductase n=1 Tax=Acinetobacter sp. TaxID=472 RepID=UPI002583D96F|nr:hypothetical protein [Acinetobacter sp.]MCE1271430.1 hypothetical protein [Acinetobacter sp.]